MSLPAPARVGRFLLLLVVLAAGFAAPRFASAQAWTSWQVADPELPAALKATGAGYEAAWNALVMIELRTRLAGEGQKRPRDRRSGADSADRLLDLELRVARVENATLGSRIAPEAVKLRTRWVREQWRARIAAGVAESLATAAQGARDNSRADSLFDVALHGYRSIGEKRRVAWMLGSLGQVALQAGQTARAESLYRVALVARRAIGDLRMIGNTLNSLGTTNYVLGRYEPAFEFLEEARDVRVQTGERAPLGATLGFLALTSMALGRTDSTEVWYRRSLALVSGAGDSTRTVETLTNFGNFLLNSGRFDEALPVQERAMRAARTAGNTLGEGRLLFQSGNALNALGRFADATQRLNEAIAVSARARDAQSLPGEWVELGRTSLLAGDGAAARPALLRGRAVADSLQNTAMSIAARNDLAIAARLEGNRDEAPRQAHAALDLAVAAGDSGQAALCAQTLGEVHFWRGELAPAEAWWTRALAAAGERVPERVVSLRLNLGAVAARLGRLDAAEVHFRAADGIAARAGLEADRWLVPLGLGDLAERRGDFARALAFDRRAATMIDTLRARQRSEATSIATFGSRLFAYEALIHLLGKLDAAHPDSGYAAEAFQWAERARARALLDAFAAAAGAAVRPRTLAEAQELLPDARTALLEYSLGDSSSTLWVVTKSRWGRFALPPRAQLQTRAEVLRRALGEPRRAESAAARSAARALYAALIAPAEKTLGKTERLIVSPDGALALVPFEALLARDAAADAKPKKDAYLAERYVISYTSSATALALHEGRAPAGAGIVALGNPRFGPGPPALATLPSTADEVRTLETLGGGATTSLSGAGATRARLLALPALGTARILHVATHGEASETEPSRSGLWLAAATDSAPPDFLSLSDIAGLRLGAELVTLSACETGVGRLERGEGVMGLTRAFMTAGAARVVVSLWPVNDRSTAQLMESFYRELLEKRRDAADALAEARRRMLRNDETRSPFYWAPFVMVGKAGGVERLATSR